MQERVVSGRWRKKGELAKGLVDRHHCGVALVSKNRHPEAVMEAASGGMVPVEPEKLPPPPQFLSQPPGIASR